jgi:hypothetical protein
VTPKDADAFDMAIQGTWSCSTSKDRAPIPASLTSQAARAIGKARPITRPCENQRPGLTLDGRRLAIAGGAFLTKFSSLHIGVVRRVRRS